MVAAILLSGVTFFSTMAGGLAALRWPSRIEWLMALAGRRRARRGAVRPRCPRPSSTPRSTASSPSSRSGRCSSATCSSTRSTATRTRTTARIPKTTGTGTRTSTLRAPRCRRVARVSSAPPASCCTRSSTAWRSASASGSTATVGLLVAVAVIGHDFSDGLNTVTILRAARHPRHAQRRWLVAVAIAPAVGALVGDVRTGPEEVLPVDARVLLRAVPLRRLEPPAAAGVDGQPRRRGAAWSCSAPR